MAGPAGVRRQLPVPRASLGTLPGPPAPVRCPHCGLEVLLLAVHLTEAHPEQPQPDTAADRAARAQEAARQAGVAAELARQEAEAAQRKAAARARRQAIEGPQGAGAEHRRATPTDEAWEPLRRAGDPRRPSTERGTTGPGTRPAEGPMALAFRLAREKKNRAG